MEGITIRTIREEDYILIDSWWKMINKLPPPRNLLPENGLHGLMACKDGRPIVCTYLYLTNSKFGYCDYMISDTNYKGRDRFEIVLELMNMSIGTAWELGCEDFWFITKNKAMLKRCKALGVKVSEEPYYLMCSSNSKKEI
tara:strand:+ start:874 stop:1296 length:423 start_codon:yes stop_codon:yes gene_type:complete